jgi:hypothetical protein
LGGVAIGNIKAVEQEIVAGIIKIIGLISRATANPAKMGNKVEAIAVFDANSVVKVAIALTNKMIKARGRK